MREFINWIRQNKWEACIHAQRGLLPSAETATTPGWSDAQLSAALDITLHALANAQGMQQTTSHDPSVSPLDGMPLAIQFNFFSTQQQALLSFLPQFFPDAGDLWTTSDTINRYYARLTADLIERDGLLHAHTKNQIAESEERYKDLFDNAHDLIHIVSASGEILYVNNAWARALGYSQEQISGASIFSFVHETDKELFANYRQKIIDGAAPAGNIVLRLLTRAGKIIFVEGFLTAKFERRQAAYTRGIFRDITDRLEDEHKLQQSNKLLQEREYNLQQLIRFAPDAIVVIDADNRVSLWNPKAEEVFGWQEEEVISRLLTDVIIPERYRVAHAAGMRRYLDTGKAVLLNRTVEVTALHRQGHEFEISLTVSHYQLGGSNFFISFIRDIHQQRLNEKELAQKRREVEESNRELEQYAWLASHDLREPVRKILTYSDLLLTKHKDSLHEAAGSYLGKIHTSARRMGNLINSLLLYSSIAHENYAYTAVPLTNTVNDVLEDLELLVADTRAIIHVEPLPTVDAIPHQVSQLFQNLISNALKYSRPGCPPEVRINAVQEGKENVTITVEDNGMGFESGNEARIFQLFRRLPGHVQEGSGIGLALCKKIVQNHNGQIQVESRPGEGTKFIIRMPLKQK